MYTGPKLTNENLVFGYDTGSGLDLHSSTRHYKGEPATNVITAGIPGYFGSGGVTLYRDNYLGLNSDSGVFQRNFVNNPATADTGAFNNNAGIYHSGLTFSNLSSNTNYILVSFDFYMIENYVRHSSSGTGLNGYLRVVYTDGSADNIGWNTSLNTPNAGDDWNNNSAYIGQWRKIALYVQPNSSKTPASINAMYIYNDRTIKGEGVFTNFIISEHATAPTGPVHYTSGTRSDTASLIDLKRTTSIDVSNVSFDSNAQPDFDGTSDYISAADSSVFDFTSAVAIELLVYVTSYSTGGSMFICQQNGNTYGGFEFWSGTNGKIYFNSNQSTNIVQTGTGSFELNKWKHLVCTADGATGKIYVNGELTATNSTTNFPSNVNGALRIGDWPAAGYGVNGSIPMVRIYNKILSTSEIKSNFNAYKNRFNI